MPKDYFETKTSPAEQEAPLLEEFYRIAAERVWRIDNDPNHTCIPVEEVLGKEWEASFKKLDISDEELFEMPDEEPFE